MAKRFKAFNAVVAAHTTVTDAAKRQVVVLTCMVTLLTLSPHPIAFDLAFAVVFASPAK